VIARIAMWQFPTKSAPNRTPASGASRLQSMTLRGTTGASVALKDLGMSESDLDHAADLASANPYWNPRCIDRAALRIMLQDAYDGVRSRGPRR
jgi:alcohol dehydrogenase class IV